MDYCLLWWLHLCWALGLLIAGPLSGRQVEAVSPACPPPFVYRAAPLLAGLVCGRLHVHVGVGHCYLQDDGTNHAIFEVDASQVEICQRQGSATVGKICTSPLDLALLFNVCVVMCNHVLTHWQLPCPQYEPLSSNHSLPKTKHARIHP